MVNGQSIKTENGMYRIVEWENWSRRFQTKWLILAGALDPPSSTKTSNRRSRDRAGNFLPGVAKDVANMEDALRINGLERVGTA